MTFPAPRSVVSGKPYQVRSVHGRVPESLRSFTGDTAIVIDLVTDLDGEEYTI